MKKLNNKGFAISSILYSIMVLFLMLLLSILGILGSRKATLDRTKKDILDELNSNYLSNRFVFAHRNITIVNSGNKDDIVYALMDGVSANDENGNQIPKENISYDLDIDTIENRDYVVTYTANNNGKTIIGTRTITFTDMQTVSNYSYTGNVQTFNPKYDGNYKIELWGASGGSDGGRGAYTRGNILLSTNTLLYVYVGFSPTYTNGNCYNSNPNDSFNGSPIGSCSGGGGATDIRLSTGAWNDFNSLKSRIMVAGGGGGKLYAGNGGSAGFIGEAGIGGANSATQNAGAGATQTTGASFGVASRYTTIGGGGYYGGNGGYAGNAGGGSSFISGYDGCDAIARDSTSDNIMHTGQSIHYSGYKFCNAVMYAGNEEMPNHNGTGKITGNTGNGFAKISLIYYY